MDRTLLAWVMAGLVGTAGVVSAHEEHQHGAAASHQEIAGAAPTEQALTGEVVDVFCYLSHGKDGLGAGHASCAQRCIQSGLPVGIKVGDQIYVATMADHNPANAKLAVLAGQQVTVHGKVLEADGQHLIAITKIESMP
jgi:hypothetical protein